MWKCEGRCGGGESGDTGLILLVNKACLNERGAGPIGKVLVYAKKVEKLRQQQLPTVPTTLGLEKQLNPFLQCSDVTSFIALREAIDNF